MKPIERGSRFSREAFYDRSELLHCGQGDLGQLLVIGGVQHADFDCMDSQSCPSLSLSAASSLEGCPDQRPWYYTSPGFRTSLHLVHLCAQPKDAVDCSVILQVARELLWYPLS